MASRKVTFFVQLVPDYYDGSNSDGTLNIAEVSAVRLTKRQPREPLPGAVVVPIVLHVDASAFSALDPVVAQVTTGENGVRLETHDG